MTHDTLDNASAYTHLGDGFAKAFDYLRSGRPVGDPVGQHFLDGEDVFVNVEEYVSKPIERGRYEAHRRYADVQYVVSGCEQMGYAPLDEVQMTEEYNPAKDIAFYKGQGQMLRVPAGTFAIFLPEDAHMPCIADTEPAPVRKVVVKVRIDA
jgi:YhcH/YjgK/YiaL family protein